jgi:SAM-dependent methyltransferase
MTDQGLDRSFRAAESGLEELRAAVKAQIGTDRPMAADVDVAKLTRFSRDLPEYLAPADSQELRRRAEEHAPWLQGPFWLGGDVVVGGTWRCDLRWLELAAQIPADLSEMRVVDVGCNAGYDPLMFKLRGADYVLACEPFEFIRQAQFLESIYRAGIDIRPIGWQGLRPETHGTFDLVHCNGVFYHELHLVKMLQHLRRMLKPGGTLLLGSIMLAAPELSEYARFVPGAYYADPTWWWVPGRLALRWMLDTAGFVVHEQFGTHPGPPGEFPTINAYFRATAARPPDEASVAAATELRLDEGHDDQR